MYIRNLIIIFGIPMFVFLFLILFTSGVSAQAFDAEQQSGVTHMNEQYIDSLRIYANENLKDKPGQYLESQFDAIVLAKAIEYDKGLARIYLDMGAFFILQGDFTEAMKYYILSEGIFVRIGDQDELARISLKFGDLLRMEKDYQMAQEKLYTALEIAIAGNNRILINKAYMYLGYVQFDLGNMDSSWVLLNLAYKYADEEVLRANITGSMAQILVRKGEFREALRIFTKNLETRREFHQHHYEAIALNNVAMCYQNLLKPDSALAYAKMGLAIARELQSMVLQQMLYRRLYEIYKMENDFEASLEAYEMYQVFHDSILNEKNIRQLEFLKFKRDMDRKILENEQLQNEVDLRKRYINIQHVAGSILTLIAILLVFLLVNAFRSRKRQRELYVQLEDKYEQIKELTELQSKMQSVIVHDVRGPVSTIENLLNTIIEDYKNLDADTIQNFLRSLHKTSLNTFLLLDNLISWLRSSRDDMIHVNEPFGLSGVCEDVISQIEGLAENKSITITNHIHDSINVYADANMVSAVFRNLIFNGLKYTHPGGYINITADPQSGMVTVCIEDNGIGISKEDIKKIMSPSEEFYQLGTHDEKGAGMGISLCISFIKKNNGKLWITSEPSKGTRVFFTLSLNNHE